MKRHRSVLIVLVWVVLSITIGDIWIRSYFARVASRTQLLDNHVHGFFSWYDGEISFGVFQPHPRTECRLLASHTILHLGLAHYQTSYYTGWVFSLPYWAVLALLLGIAGRLLFRHSKPIQPPGRACPRCGYDLRATPNRCPECGSPTTGRLAQLNQMVDEWVRGQWLALTGRHRLLR